MVLNYKVDLDKLKNSQSEEEKQNPETFVSKQNVLLNALATRMPQAGGQVPQAEPTTNGWGRTTN